MFSYTAFEDHQRIAQGSLELIALSVKKRLKVNREARVLIFSDSTGKQVDFDFSGSEKDVLERLKIYSQSSSKARSGAGRPKLGVVAREISLLPQHWEWLTNQDGGASATIRKLIDDKTKFDSSEKETIKKSQEVTYKFLSAIAGDLPHFEEAIRYLYRKDKKKFIDFIANWPSDIVQHALTLSENVFKN